MLVDEAGDLQYIAASHERAHLLELFQLQNQEGPCQDCFSTGAPVSVDDEAEAVVQAMADVATIGLLQQRELDRAHAVEGQLQRALQTRIGVELAKGIISERLGISMDEAFTLLRSYSRDHNEKLHDAARDIVTGVLAASDLS